MHCHRQKYPFSFTIKPLLQSSGISSRSYTSLKKGQKTLADVDKLT